jgi:uncharacterized protein DUF6941
MPELDFMVTADYVRAEGGVLHMIAAGFDQISLPTVPATRAVGIGLRILVDVAEAQAVHRLSLIYQGSDGERLAEIHGTFGPIGPEQPLPPEGRPYGLPIAFNLPLPIPAYGDYSLELFIDDQTEAVKSITLTAAPLPGIPGTADHA